MAMDRPTMRPASATSSVASGVVLFFLKEKPLATSIERDLAEPLEESAVEFVVHKDAMVWPMVPAGVSNDEIRVARDMAPDWEEEVL